MSILELARNAARLDRILCTHDSDSEHRQISTIVFQFEGGRHLALTADIDSDELVWNQTINCLETFVDLISRCPPVAKTYGLPLIWSWEMKNHQGYFDALQLEFIGDVIFQFKVAASRIEVFEVRVCKLP